MSKMKAAGVAALCVGILCAVPLSVRVSPGHVSVSLDRAAAEIGRPLTPMSIAGVNRRANRRAYYRSGAYQSSNYYGTEYGTNQQSSTYDSAYAANPPSSAYPSGYGTYQSSASIRLDTATTNRVTTMRPTTARINPDTARTRHRTPIRPVTALINRVTTIRPVTARISPDTPRTTAQFDRYLRINRIFATAIVTE